jgi:hypothetical protein
VYEHQAHVYPRPSHVQHARSQQAPETLEPRLVEGAFCSRRRGTRAARHTQAREAFPPALGAPRALPHPREAHAVAHRVGDRDCQCGPFERHAACGARRSVFSAPQRTTEKMRAKRRGEIGGAKGLVTMPLPGALVLCVRVQAPQFGIYRRYNIKPSSLWSWLAICLY